MAGYAYLIPNPEVSPPVEDEGGDVFPTDGAYVPTPLTPYYSNGLRKRDFTQSTGGGSGPIEPGYEPAPNSASYVVLDFNSRLSAERRLVAGTNITFTDGGANGNLTINATGGGGAGTSISVATMAALASTPGTVSGQLATVLGFYSANDGGGGTFYWGAVLYTPLAGMVVNATGGQWVRLRDDVNYYSLRWFGAKGDGSNNDGAVVQAAFDYLGTNSIRNVELHIPAGRYKVSQRITGCPGAGNGANGADRIRVTGVNCAGTQDAVGTEATVFVWSDPGAVYAGAGASCIFWLGGQNWEVHNCHFTCASGSSLAEAIECGPCDGTNAFTTGFKFRGCTFRGADSGSSTVEVGIGIGLAYAYEANKENFLFEECMFFNVSIGIHLNSGQCYDTLVNKCSFVYIDYGNPGIPRGWGFYNNSSSTQIAFTECDFNYVEVGLWLNNVGHVELRGGQAESCKKLIVTSTFAGYDGQNSPIKISGMRAPPNKVGTATANFSAGDTQFISVDLGCPVEVDSCSFFLTPGAETPWSFRVSPAAVYNLRNCTFPNKYPFSNTGGHVGLVRGIYMEGCYATYAGTASEVGPLDTLHGAYNYPTDFTCSTTIASETTFAVTLAKEEIDTTYRVELALVSLGSGASAPGSMWVTSKASTGFTINVATSPGVTKSVVIRYKIWR